MKFSIFISIISVVLVSCSSIKKVVLLDQQLKNDSTISNTDYSQHKLKEGDRFYTSPEKKFFSKSTRVIYKLK